MRSATKQLLRRLLQGKRIFWRLPGNPGNAIALTFDDGPHPEVTPQVLAILDQRAVKATFFLLGENVLLYPEIVEDILQHGHAVGNHGMRHDGLGFVAQVKECQPILRKCGITSRLVRPQYRLANLWDPLRLLCGGHRIAMWSYDPKDSMRNVGKLVNNPAEYSGIGSGDIVLMHDENPICVEELPRLLDVIAAKGLACVSL